MSITGAKKDDSSAGTLARDTYLKKIRDLDLATPLMVGFGLSSKRDLESIAKHAAGGIIGSAFIKAIDTPQYLSAAESFLKSLF